MRRSPLSPQQVHEQAQILADLLQDHGLKTKQVHIDHTGGEGVHAWFSAEETVGMRGAEPTVYVDVTNGGYIRVWPYFASVTDDKALEARVRALIKKAGLGEWLL